MSLITHVTQKSIELWLHNACHKIYLSGPFRIFCLYVIPTISYLRAQTIETSSLPTDSSHPLFKQVEIFPGILTVYFNCKYFPKYKRELLECPLGISPSGRNPCGGHNTYYNHITLQLKWSIIQVKGSIISVSVGTPAPFFTTTILMVGSISAVWEIPFVHKATGSCQQFCSSFFL